MALGRGNTASVLIRSGDSQVSGTVRFCRHGTDGMRDPEFPALDSNDLAELDALWADVSPLFSA